MHKSEWYERVSVKEVWRPRSVLLHTLLLSSVWERETEIRQGQFDVLHLIETKQNTKHFMCWLGTNLEHYHLNILGSSQMNNKLMAMKISLL